MEWLSDAVFVASHALQLTLMHAMGFAFDLHHHVLPLDPIIWFGVIVLLFVVGIIGGICTLLVIAILSIRRRREKEGIPLRAVVK